MAQNIKQEGSDWVRTESNVRQVDPNGELRVQSQGAIVVHGVPGDRITYTLTQSSKVTGEAEARRLLSGGDVTVRPTLGATFVISQGSSPLVSTRLDLNVPRTMRGGRPPSFGLRRD